MASILESFKRRLKSRSTAGFLMAAMVLGVLVGMATSALALLIDFV